MRPPAQIVCVDCGGQCHVLNADPAEDLPDGAIVAYRCGDCLDRWDVVLGEVEDV